MRTLAKVSRIKCLRLGKGLTQGQLAAKAGGLITQAQVSQIEGGRKPRVDEKILLAQALEMQPDELFQD